MDEIDLCRGTIPTNPLNLSFGIIATVSSFRFERPEKAVDLHLQLPAVVAKFCPLHAI